MSAPAKEKVCEDWMAEMLGAWHPRLEYPFPVHGITYGKEPVVYHKRREVGCYVAVRPCDKELAGKTFLGIYLGDIALHPGVLYNKKDGVLEVKHLMHNPAIWVPDLKRIIFGCGSSWTVIKVRGLEADLRYRYRQCLVRSGIVDIGIGNLLKYPRDS